MSSKIGKHRHVSKNTMTASRMRHSQNMRVVPKIKKSEPIVMPTPEKTGFFGKMFGKLFGRR